MKKVILAILTVACIFLISCTFTEKERQTTENGQNGEEAAEKKAEDKGQGEQQYPEVVDGTGVSRQLRLGNINEKDQGDQFYYMGFASDYSQVADGHYYWLRTDGSGNYTVYQDKGKKVVRFAVGDDYYVSHFVKHGDGFYALQQENECGLGCFESKLIYIDIQTGTVKIVEDTTDELVGGQVFWKRGNSVFFGDFFYFYDYSEYYSEDYCAFDYYTGIKVGKGKLTEMSLNGKREKRRFPRSSELKGQDLTFMNGKIYYGMQQGKMVTLYSYDLENGEQKEVLCYERADLAWKFVNRIVIDEDYLYCQDYIIPRQGGKMIQMPGNESSVISSPDGKYIFYGDRKSRIHRVNRKNQRDVVICDDIRIDGFDCTEDGIYVKEVNKAWEKREDMESWDEWADPSSNNLYYMDYDGKNRKRIWKEVI